MSILGDMMPDLLGDNKQAAIMRLFDTKVLTSATGEELASCLRWLDTTHDEQQAVIDQHKGSLLQIVEQWVMAVRLRDLAFNAIELVCSEITRRRELAEGLVSQGEMTWAGRTK